MKKLSFLLVAILCISMVLAGCAKADPADDGKLKVALILSGPANDQGWNAIALAGLQAAEAEFGIETTYAENVDIAGSEAAYNDYASQGYDLVIGHGFQYGDPAATVSAKFPNQYFMATEAFSQTDNMASYIMSCEEGGYLMGVLSASMSKTGKIGVVGGIEQPSIIKEVEAFKLGAKRVNPDIEVYSAYINSFTDVTLGKEAAMNMIDKGADVLYHVANQAGTGLIKACEEKGLLACGNSYDQNSIAPDTVICSTEYNMTQVILTAVGKAKDGTYEGGIYYLGMDDNVVSISGYNGFEDKIPQDVKDLMESIEKEIMDGTFVVPVVEASTN